MTDILTSACRGGRIPSSFSVTVWGNGVMDAETSSGTYTPFASSQTADPIIESLEGEAREPKKGLWADPHPVPPWESRRLKGKSSRSANLKLEGSQGTQSREPIVLILCST